MRKESRSASLDIHNPQTSIITGYGIYDLAQILV